MIQNRPEYREILILLVVGLTHESQNNEPLQAQRSRRNGGLGRDILRKSWVVLE